MAVTPLSGRRHTSAHHGPERDASERSSDRLPERTVSGKDEPDTGRPELEETVPLSARGRRVRLVAAAVVFALITVGTVHGSDDAFPFGPLRMYATRDNPNGSVVQAVVLAVSRAGRTHDVTNARGAPRRAELEGRMGEFITHPQRFAQIAPSFLPRANAGASDPDVRIELIRRRYPLHHGRSGPPVDQIVSIWTVVLR